MVELHLIKRILKMTWQIYYKYIYNYRGNIFGGEINNQTQREEKKIEIEFAVRWERAHKRLIEL